MADLDALRDAFDEIFAAQRRLRGRDAKTLDGVTLAQLRLLRMLAIEGPQPTSQLAVLLGVNPASVTQMLDALERRGLVERTRSSRDRRVVIGGLTSEGRRRAEERRAEQRAGFEAAFAGVGDSELESALRVLARYVEYMDSV